MKCPTCKGNGRIEMLEHCPDCEVDGKCDGEVRCVCGCIESDHDWPACEKNNCGLFRPAMPWPNSVGAWWCSTLPDVPYAFGGSRLWLERWRDRESFENEYGPTRFTKLVEQNPFARPLP